MLEFFNQIPSLLIWMWIVISYMWNFTLWANADNSTTFIGIDRFEWFKSHQKTMAILAPLWILPVQAGYMAFLTIRALYSVIIQPAVREWKRKK